MDLDAKCLGNRLRKIRHNLSLSQKEAGLLIGISPQHFGNIENGVRPPTLDLFVRLCNALNVNPNYLLYDSLNMNIGAPAQDEGTRYFFCQDHAILEDEE